MATKFIDEINRLFDELVRDPWRQPLLPRAETHPLSRGMGWEIEIPLAGVERNDVVVSTEGRQLTVSVQRHSAQKTTEGRTEVTTSAQQHFRQTFSLPEGMELGRIESHFEHGLLRIRISLRKRDR